MNGFQTKPLYSLWKADAIHTKKNWNAGRLKMAARNFDFLNGLSELDKLYIIAKLIKNGVHYG